MTLLNIRNIEEKAKVLIDGVQHICTMASGYANNDKVNFRFTNMMLPKKIWHSVYNEFYYPCEALFSDIKSGKITFDYLGESNAENIQLTLF